MHLMYSSRAEGQLYELPQTERIRILRKMEFYRCQKDPLAFADHLEGDKVYRFRIGQGRVLFDVHGNTMFVLLVRRRDKAYKNL